MNDNQRAQCPRCNGRGGGYVRTGPDDQWDSEECDWCWGAGYIPAALAEHLRACDRDLAVAHSIIVKMLAVPKHRSDRGADLTDAERAWLASAVSPPTSREAP